MTTLLPEQVAALEELHLVCRPLTIDLVVIGAIALHVWMPDERRLTEDVDVAVALDLDEFAPLTARLKELGWRQDVRWEPRWHSRPGARVDLLPAGRRARKERQIVWPRAGTVMRVVGYDSLFTHAADRELAPGLNVRIAPPPVLALLKMGAYLDDRASRQKDLEDLLLILERYAEDSDRRFGDDVLDAELHYDQAGAFLLGRDLRAWCTADEIRTVRMFLQVVTDADFQWPVRLRLRSFDRGVDESPVTRWLAALARGLG